MEKNLYLVKNCIYCNKEYRTNRKSKIFCSENCRIFENRWKNKQPKTPYKFVLSRNVTDLLDKAKELQKHKYFKNPISEKVIQAIELGHYEVISKADKEYIIKTYYHYEDTKPFTPEELDERIKKAIDFLKTQDYFKKRKNL